MEIKLAVLTAPTTIINFDFNLAELTAQTRLVIIDLALPGAPTTTQGPAQNRVPAQQHHKQLYLNLLLGVLTP